MRILIIDDSEDSCDVTEAALMSGGYRDIDKAQSAIEAFKLLDVGKTGTEPPGADIILLDIMMPEMDGIETCARIRNDPRYADVPIIMVTSSDDMDSLANAFVAGATDYVIKPVNRIELIARVRAGLKLKAELDRRQARERELLNFLSNWGDRRPGRWIDSATGLFTGEGAEAYFTAISERRPGEDMAVLALAMDHLEIVRAAHGAEGVASVLAKVATAIRAEAATIGVVAGAYPNGVMVIVAPERDQGAAEELAQRLRKAVALALINRGAIAANRITASISVAAGKVASGMDRVKLLTQALAQAEKVAQGGGDHIVQ